MASKITINKPDKPQNKSGGMTAGNFYAHKRSGQLVFVAARSGPNSPLAFDAKDCPASTTPVSAIGGSYNGFPLYGLFGFPSDYEEVDVEITVKAKE